MAKTTTAAPNGPGAALAAAMANKPPPSSDKLAVIRNKMARAREIELEISTLTERQRALSRERQDLVGKELPDMFQEVGIKTLGLEADGNMPEYEAKLADYYKANIAADWDEERREAGFRFLEKQGAGDLIKTVFTVELGRGTSKVARALAAALRKMKIAFDQQKAVPHSSLTAWVRERFKKGEPLSTQELEIVGATAGVVVQLKKKESK